MPKAKPEKRKGVRGSDHYRWKGDLALTASKRQRAKTLFEMGPCEECGKPGTDRHHKDTNTGNNSADNIAILCRRCHMLVDGRLEATKARLSRSAKDRIKPAAKCFVCLEFYKPLRKGRCHKCSDYYRAHKKERSPEDLFKTSLAKESPCPICRRVTRLKTKGRCVVCYNHWRKNGTDRTSFSFKVSAISEAVRKRPRSRTKSKYLREIEDDRLTDAQALG